MAEYSVPLVDAARRNDDSARTLAATDDGVRRFDAVRDELDLYETTERATITNRLDDADADSALAIMAATSGFVGSILLIVLFAGYLRRTIVRPLRRAAVMAGELAGGDLTVRMPETGAGEIGVLARAFNTMASSLEVSRAELAASRSRVVVAADETRRRIERDLHDGTQQRLVSLSLQLRLAESTVPAELEEARATIGGVAGELNRVIDELREISRGIHPAILSEGGLGPALRTLARRSAIPVELGSVIDHRLPEPVEVAAYYVVSEALTNAVKHADASRVNVDADVRDGSLRLSIRDDGVGGADPAEGSGLIGLRDRVEALGGTVEIDSPAGRGTCVTVELPVEPGASSPETQQPPQVRATHAPAT
jgi:signal transduction histidine kinase